MARIITGIAKGKRLLTPGGEATRPTSDRIKEAMFSAIQFDIEGRRVLDLYAGSGQLGLEAMSRGAESAMFVDADPEVIALIKKNALTTGFFDRCRFLASDAKNYLRKAAGRSVFDLFFIDPPYAMQGCGEAVEKILTGGLAAKGALLVLESGEEPLDYSADPRFQVLKSTAYGKKTALTILLYTGAEG